MVVTTDFIVEFSLLLLLVTTTCYHLCQLVQITCIPIICMAFVVSNCLKLFSKFIGSEYESTKKLFIHIIEITFINFANHHL